MLGRRKVAFVLDIVYCVQTSVMRYALLETFHTYVPVLVEAILRVDTSVYTESIYMWLGDENA